MIINTNLKQTFTRIMRYLWWESLFSVFISALIYYLYEERDLTFLASFSFVPAGFFGTILSVFLAFRNNNAYSRWWEARQIWGDLVNASRMFATQVRTYMATDTMPAEAVSQWQRELVFRHIATVHLMRMQLRQCMDVSEVSQFLSSDDLELVRKAANPTSAILARQADELARASAQGCLSDYRFVDLMSTVERFFNILGACERIKNTPFPREYDGFVRYLIWILIVIMPIYLLGLFTDNISKMLIIPTTLAITLIIGFANKAGEMLEDPFENRIHDIPMTSLCAKIEADLRSQVGETSNAPLESRKDVLVVW